MSSKLRLSGKGTRGTATLSEKEQIDLAIALSLQQGKDPQQIVEEPLAAGGTLAQNDQPIGEPSVGPAAANAPDLQQADEPRKRRAVATRRTYVQEESDDESFEAPSAGGRQGADDYKPESSASGSDTDDDSDFTGDDSEDEAPRKKRKSEAPKGKKPPAKAPAARKKAGTEDKATGAAGAAARGAKPPGAAARTAGAIGACGRKGAAASTAAPGPAPAAPVARPPVSKPTTTARLAPGAAGLGVTARPAQQENDGHGSGALADAEVRSQGTDVGGSEDRQHHEAGAPSARSERDVDATETATAVKPLQTKPPQTKAAELKAKAVAAPKQPPKPLVVVNRATPGSAPASAPFKPPIGTSGGGAPGIKASTPLLSGTMQYRVPGLRRPGGSSVTKKTS